MSDEYKDIDGNPITLERLVLQENAWACSRIRYMQKRIAELEDKRNLLIDCGAPSEDDCTRGINHGACKKHQHYWRLRAEGRIEELKAAIKRHKAETMSAPTPDPRDYMEVCEDLWSVLDGK